jgi:hypothetical protein
MRASISVLALALALLSVSPAFADETQDEDREAELVRRRGVIKTYHRSMGYTTWISLAATTTLGTLRYAHVIGFGDRPCTGESGFWCGGGLLLWHTISATFSTLSYAVTRILAAIMPDPYDAGADNPTLRLHRALSWVHLAGMIAMPILGIATSSTEGSTRDTLATAHLITGYATLGTLSFAASLMTF